MKIAIHGKEFTSEISGFIQHVFDRLTEFQWEFTISKQFTSDLKRNKINYHSGTSYRELPADTDMVFSIGGDGTLLEAVTHVGNKEIPILGINTGRLGFLATTAREEFDEAMSKISNGEYGYDMRTLLHLDASEKLFNGLNFALNDVAILKKDTSSMITVHAYLDGEFLNSYWADGIIISTPTGSTGYSISCGGPVVIPGSHNFVITPVSPHNLTVRPMVVPDEAELSFTIEGRSKHFLVSLDSRYETVDDSIKLVIRKEDFKAKLVKIEGYSYFRTLRQKLNWGLDARN
ncbi:NAD kinase [Fulvivirga sedimenti]|uniref:NAD kinase n=1 Tax=Fulvivirga sedimenti TaxID=2879465 RepID=A0A9X1HNT7_9BACT|nr:NAD kinase [Fulvivirga sedimenti]MCA6074425.1 NAD kinase [Fulvivirga sedimenti]